MRGFDPTLLKKHRIAARATSASVTDLGRPSDGTETQCPARVHGLRTIILAGHGASITSEAVRWLAREQVACYLMERSGEAFAVLASAVEIDGRRRALALRQKQFEAVLDPRKRFGIARKIVRVKLATLGGIRPMHGRFGLNSKRQGSMTF
jgi:CRISPR/Cas system-associated endonuclease Cas1